MCTDKRKKGNIVIFTIAVLSFISWTIFTSSFLLSGEVSILKDRRESKILDEKEGIINSFFVTYIKNIEKEINENEKIKDIIHYVSLKENFPIWTENYSRFVKTDSGYFISKITINRKNFYFSESDDNFNYLDFISSKLLENQVNTVIIYFVKDLKNIYIEDSKNIYDIEITCQLEVRYKDYKAGGGVENISSIDLKVMTFDIN